jgi:hypothetical protein
MIRTSGGGTSIDSGEAFLSSIRGNMVKTGYVPEVLNMTVTPAPREEGESPITATINRDTFVAYVPASTTITLTYTTAWSADPALYGISVSGTPVNGDIITVVYVQAERGTITPAMPTTFNSTGWNLYDNATGYARVVRYSTVYGFKLGGTYSLVDFSETLTGARTSVTLENGYFTVPSDGYVFVTGGDETTYIYATWADWTDTYEGDFETYTVDTIDLSTIMVGFPNGLLAVGNVRDEINFNTQTAISRIERLAYTPENLAIVIASGVEYDTDTNYIYAVRSNPFTTTIEVSGTYTVSDHGIEFYTGSTDTPVITEILYGENLKEYLQHDVPEALADLNSKLLKPITITLDTVTNTSGSYTHTTTNGNVTEDMKPIQIQYGIPQTFLAPVEVTTGDGFVTLTCSSVSGTSTVSVTMVHTQPVDGGQSIHPAVTSTEFDILADRIGAISTLTTTNKSNTVGAINEVNTAMANKANKSDLRVKYLANSAKTTITITTTSTLDAKTLFLVMHRNSDNGLTLVSGGGVVNNLIANASLTASVSGNVITLTGNNLYYGSITVISGVEFTLA